MTLLHHTLGMTDEEHTALVALLGREPRPAELAMYSVMWSEHCSYKSSRPHLSRFPSDAPWVVVGPGENAGVVDLGDGWLAALRIESHNHPSFVEPYQGAATGVGGIIRDVFTMGARPVALWDQIRFGPLDEPHNRYLFSGVVSGIAGYGNAVGVPTLGGEVEFDPSYQGNPLVNVMCLGIMRAEQLVRGTSGPPGTVAILLGRATGRDGIGGASVLASSSFDTAGEEKRASVQVGDPFEEKKLIEACLQLYRQGLVSGVQDLGAAGLTCATSEPAARAGHGMEVDLDRVHVRQPGMTAAELLMSESQERMMAFVPPEHVEQVLAVAARWEIDASVVGEVRAGGTLTVRHRGQVVAEIPAVSLTEAPALSRPSARPDWLDRVWARPGPDLTGYPVAETLLALLDQPGIGSPAWIYQQYDHMLFLDTVVGPGGDGSLLRIKGTSKGLAVSTDGNGALCLLDPRRGAARLVHEAALNVAVAGAKPMAVVDNLNLGNPEKPEVMWQLIEMIAGISEACTELGVPVVGGNVSLYNETEGTDINPTPVIGMLGLADPMPVSPPRLDAAGDGMEIWEVGPSPSPNPAGTAVQVLLGGEPGGRPHAPDHVTGRRLVELVSALAHRVPVLHDVSRGGLAVALTEVCIASDLGAIIEIDDPGHLFSEDPHRVVVVTHGGLPPGVDLPSRRIGRMGGSSLRFGSVTVDLEEAAHIYRQAIPRRMGRSHPEAESIPSPG